MFTLVPGATLVGETVRERVRITTTVTFGESTFEYVRVAATARDGSFPITVAYPGRYSVGGETVVVSEAAVVTGATITRE